MHNINRASDILRKKKQNFAGFSGKFAEKSAGSFGTLFTRCIDEVSR